MARNRKRAKDRQSRRPEAARLGRAGTDLREPFEDRLGDGAPAGEPAAPDPLEHASPDAELAEAQLALGRLAPGRADADAGFAEDGEEEDEDGPLPDELDPGSVAGGAPPGGRRPSGGDGGRGIGGGGSVAAGGGAPPARVVPSEPLPLRLAGFLQGSWRELQRVQWPDRRQVMQATGVVIGFVIVAGILLGVSDLVAKRVVDFILYGHFS